MEKNKLESNQIQFSGVRLASLDRNTLYIASLSLYSEAPAEARGTEGQPGSAATTRHTAWIPFAAVPVESNDQTTGATGRCTAGRPHGKATTTTVSTTATTAAATTTTTAATEPAADEATSDQRPDSSIVRDAVSDEPAAAAAAAATDAGDVHGRSDQTRASEAAHGTRETGPRTG